jgi:tetrathionate reductase subunit B
MKTMNIDLDKCVGCYNCQLACKDEHVGNDWSPISKPQPEGHFWMKVNESERGTQPKVVVDWMPVSCMHCQEAPCIPSCSENAIYRRDDGIVIINPEKCTGCKDCMGACPYKVIYFHEEMKLCQKCTMCAHLLDRGWKEPRCVTACPNEALVFGDLEKLDELRRRSEEWKPETGAKPLVRYLGLPRPFVAGEIYSPKDDACIEGAKVTLTDLLTGGVATALTDNYGDFWLKGLQGSRYSLAIEKDGYYPKEIKNIRPNDGMNLGSIKLYRRV